MILFWDKYNQFVVDDQGEIPLVEKPELSFEFDELVFSTDNSQISVREARYSINGEQHSLTVGEVEELREYAANLRANYVPKVFGVDSENRYLGVVDATDPRISVVAAYEPANNHPNWRYIEGEWTHCYFVNEEGKLAETGTMIMFWPPYGERSRWDFQEQKWVTDENYPSSLKEGQQAFMAWLTSSAIELASRNNSVEVSKEVSTQIAKAILESLGDAVPEEAKANIQVIIDSLLDEINNYCETHDDFRIVIDNLKSSNL